MVERLTRLLTRLTQGSSGALETLGHRRAGFPGNSRADAFTKRAVSSGHVAVEDAVSEPRATFTTRSTSPSVSTIWIFTVSAVCGSRIEMLGQDRYAAPAFEVVRIHHPLGDSLILA